jgi:hypothetical protein
MGEDRSPDRHGWASRAFDAVAEWLLPDPTARVERALREFKAREQREQGPDEKPSQKG